MTPEQALWSEVLYAAVTDAVEGVAVIGSQNTVSRTNDNDRARRYITQPNADFNQVCHMAGLDPVAVREHVTRKIAKAPTSAELAGCKREITKQTRAKPAPKPAPKATPRPAQTLTHNGQTRTIYDWAVIIGVSHMTIHLRLRKGWSIEAALAPNLAKRGSLATQLARYGLDKSSTLESVEDYFLNLKRMRNAPAQTTNVVTAPNTAPNATNRAPVIEYAVPITASPMPPMKPTNRMIPPTEPVISSFAKNGRRQNCRQRLAATTAELRTSAFIKSFMITGLAPRHSHSKCSYPTNEMGVAPILCPFQGTGGGRSAQEIVNLNFSQDCAA